MPRSTNGSGAQSIPLSTTINPGNQISAILAYDVPVGTTPAVMEFHDSAFSGGAKVALN